MSASHDDSNEGGSISSGNDNNSNRWSEVVFSSINFDTESRKSDDRVVLVTGSESASMGSLGLSIDEHSKW